MILSPLKFRIYCPGHDPLDMHHLGRGVTRGEDRGFKLLGAPLGSWEYEEEVLGGRIASVQELLDKLQTHQDPHIEYTLLRSCFLFFKVAYSMRTVDVLQHEEFLVRFNQAVRGAVEGILGAPLTQSQWTQASFPIGKVGLGLWQAVQHGPAAYPSYYCVSQGLVGEMLRAGMAGETREDTRKVREDLEEGCRAEGGAEDMTRMETAMRSLNQQLGNSLTSEEVGNLSQCWISALIDTESSSRLFLVTP